MGCHAFLQGLFLTQGSNSQSLGSPALAGRFFTTSATCEAHIGTWSESESCSVVSDSLRPRGLYSPWNSPGQNTGVGSCSLPRGIFPTQGSNPGLPHCRRILYQLSHNRSPRILEWVAHPFSSRSSYPGIEPTSLAPLALAGMFFTS